MLTARRAPQACQSCRLHLLSLFSHGFTTSAAPSTTLPTRLPSTRRARAGLQALSSLTTDRSTGTYRSTGRRQTFSSSTRSCADVESQNSKPSVAEMEETVRHARQTFGETLPKAFLTDDEYVLYERLYGPPVRETRGDDLEILVERDEDGEVQVLRENEEGELEEVVEMEEEELVAVDEQGNEIRLEAGEFIEEIELGAEGEADAGLPLQEVDDYGNVTVQARSQREMDAILRLQRDMDSAMARPAEEEEDIDEEFEEEEEEFEEEEEEEFDEEEDGAYLSGDAVRTHPNTMAGRFGTSPTTLQLPQDHLVLPITELLQRVNSKHLAEAAEKAFGGKGLPYSAATPGSKKLLGQKHIGLEASQHRMSEVEADAYMAGVMPAVYSSVMGTLVEVRKRLGSGWIRDLIFREGGEGPRVLDAGAGGAGLIAWREIVQAEWDVLRDEGMVEGEAAPQGKAAVLTGASTLRHRMSRFLENTTFIPRIPDYIHSANPENLLDGAPAVGRKSFDVIIAPHTLFPLKDEYKRKNMVQNLWSLLDPNGGVLILLEKGLPRGFEAIAGARSLLLDKHISSPGSTHLATPLESPTQEQSVQKETGMIIAPCTNHTACPMYLIPGFSAGRKDFCHFSQRFIRPPFLQRLLSARDRNHEDVKFSYLAVRRGMDLRQSTSTQPGFAQGDSATESAFSGFEGVADSVDDQPAQFLDVEACEPLSLPRSVLPPLKRRKHVTLDLCTPSGTLERWTVPKSFSGTAYRDARKSRWGDLWALGAKTRIVRPVRLGRKGDDLLLTGAKGKDKGRDRQAVERKKRTGKNVFEIEVGQRGESSVREVTGKGERSVERRTKKGRVEVRKRDITEDEY